MSDEVKEEDEVALTVQIPVSVSWDRIRNLLCSALEGGANYWYIIHEFKKPPQGVKPWGDSSDVFRHLDYPCREGGELIIHDLEGDIEPEKIRPVNRTTLVEGLKVMAKDYPRHFSDFIQETDDGTTGDVFLQCVCFGEVIFG